MSDSKDKTGRRPGGEKPPGFLFRAFAPLLTVGLSACAVGPNFHPPAPPKVALTPEKLPAMTVAAGGVAQQYRSGADISGDWWTLYHSPELNALIKAGLEHSPTLAASQQTLIEAEETVRAEQGGLLPSLSGSYQATREQVSPAELASFGAGSQASTTSIAPFTLYNADLNVSYSPDVFGGVRRQIESDAAQADYQRDELEAAYLTLTSNIVTSAIGEASLLAQIDATNKVIAAEQQELSILTTQMKLGGVAQAQVLQQQATLASTEATLPPLQAQLAQTRNQLAVYVGAFPGDFHEADFTLAGLTLPQDLPVSLPSAVVAQRPDIQAASAQLHTATANLGIADANLLPQFTLSAQLGHEALTSGTLFTPQTLVWSLVAGVTQPLFEGGTLTARRKAALAALRVAGAQYQETVLSAFQNVADALQVLQYDALTLAAAQEAEDAAASSLAVTTAQYKLGGQPFTAVLTAQTTYQNAAIAEVKAAASRLSDTAALYQALGGGWWHREDVAGSCCGIIP
jgi:NodT family efflux transporter outer membrane factor (OMF) lipoprotein